MKNTLKILVFLAILQAPAAMKAQDVSNLPSIEISSKIVPSSIETSTGTVPFRIIHPPEGGHIPLVKKSFVYGSADPAGTLIINGSTVPVYHTGGFITMIEYSTGPFIINALLQSAATEQSIIRKVRVEEPLSLPKNKLSIENVRPEMGMGVQPGDSIDISFRGTPDKKAYFQVRGLSKKYPLVQQSSGYYRGAYIVQPSDELNKARVTVTLSDEINGRKITAKSAGAITRIPDDIPEMYEIISDTAIMRAGPLLSNYDKAGYLLFPSAGTRVRAIGRRGDELKIRLTSKKSAWMSSGETRPLPAGTPAVLTVTGSIAVVEKDNSIQVRVPLGSRVPFETTQSADGTWLDISFFGAYSNTDWINYQSPERVVKIIQWFQDDPETYRLHVITRPNSWWGYDARFEGSTFVLEFRGPPAESSSNPLKGLLVAVDAGHSADDTGAIGPLGTLEKDINLSLAKALEQKLTEQGARVLMTRSSDELTGLYNRPQIAWQARADILISIHNNALPEGENPFEKNGYGIYYFHPASYALAKEIHGSFKEAFGKNPEAKTYLRDDGLRYGNLVLTRPPQLPSVLIECAYLIIPREEALLISKEFQLDCAQAIAAGIRKYAENMREK